MRRIFTFSFPAPVYIYQAGPGGRAERRINSGIQQFAKRAREHYGVNLRARWVDSGGMPITSGRPQSGGVQYRGMWDGRQIVLHSGLVAPNRYVNPFPSALNIGQIVWHEYLHSLGFGHVNDPLDIMHPNAPMSITASRRRLVALFGSFVPTELLDENETFAEWDVSEIGVCTEDL